MLRLFLYDNYEMKIVKIMTIFMMMTIMMTILTTITIVMTMTITINAYRLNK
jgi:hypothetical protein